MNFGDLNDLEEKEIELLIKELSIIQSKLKGHIIPEKYPCQISNLMASIVLSLRGHLDLTRDNIPTVWFQKIGLKNLFLCYKGKTVSKS